MFVHYGHDLDRSAVGRGVELEVHRPHGVRRIRDGTVRSRRRGACAGGVEAPAGTHRAKAAESSSGGRLSLLSSRPAPRAAAAGGRPRAGSHTTVTGAPASPARQVSQSRHERALIPWCWLLQAGRARRRREATCDLDHHSPADPRRLRRGWSQDRGPYVARQAGGAIARPAMEGHGWRIAFQARDPRGHIVATSGPRTTGSQRTRTATIGRASARLTGRTPPPAAGRCDPAGLSDTEESSGGALPRHCRTGGTVGHGTPWPEW